MTIPRTQLSGREITLAITAGIGLTGFALLLGFATAAYDAGAIRDATFFARCLPLEVVASTAAALLAYHAPFWKE